MMVVTFIAPMAVLLVAGVIRCVRFLLAWRVYPAKVLQSPNYHADDTRHNTSSRHTSQEVLFLNTQHEMKKSSRAEKYTGRSRPLPADKR